MRRNLAKIFAPLLLTGFLASTACQYADPIQPERIDPKRATRTAPGAGDSVFGKDGLKLFGGDRQDDRSGPGIGVNSYLWRASLDTISFLPLSSADPFGGVIITDWYTPQETPTERFKVTIYILARNLRADGLRVAIFRQEQSETGVWVDSAINSATSTSLENKILERARQLRTSGVSQ